MKMELRVERRIDYYNLYSIGIELTENLSKEDYATLIGGIKLIESVLDPYINRAKIRLELARAAKGGKNESSSN